jgi:hypothetical protein
MKLNTLAVALCGALALTLGPTPDGSLGWLSAAQAQEKVSPEVGKALNAVTSLLKAGKAKEALGKIRDVEAISGRSAAETALMEKLRFAAAQQSTDPDTMARAYDALKGAGRLAGAENLQYMAAVAGTYSRVNRHKEALNWATRYFAEGGNDPAMRQVQTAAQYNSGDVGPIVKNTLAEIQAAEKAGQTPSRDKINLLWNAANRAKDANALAFANEKLLQYYPSKEMWANAIASTATRKGFAPRFQLDLYRLRLLSDNMRNDEDYEELASLAGQAGFAEEGRKAIEAGFKAGVLGQGAKAERHQRLKVFLDKKLAESKAGYVAAEKAARESKQGDGLVMLGQQLAFAGNAKAGVAMIQEGIQVGQLKREGDAHLALGQAFFLAGDTGKAIGAWRSVKGDDGVADVAKLWANYARSAKR